MTDEKMGSHLTETQKEVRAAIDEIAKMVSLRRTCLELALGHSNGVGDGKSVVDMAGQFYDYIMALEQPK